MIVMKFGGTSLANAERIKKVGEIIKSRLRKKPIVVVSAVAGVTDSLINLAKESAKGKNPNKGVEEIINLHKKIIRELSLRENLIIDECVKLHDLFNGVYLLKEISPRSLDFIASFGEILSSKIIAEYLNYIGIKSTRYSGWEVGIISDDNFTNAEVLPETYERVKKFFKKLNGVPVVTGFIAKNRDNEITTLGRGGSDYTAAIIGAGLNVKEIEIWTDVDGIKTTDPKIVKGAKQWKRITFEEASEMAYFGAKILHPKTIEPAVKRQIPIRILNTYNPTNEGTLIVNDSNEFCQVRAISLKKDVIIIKATSTKMLYAYGFLARIFEVFSRYKTSIDLVVTSEVSVSLTIDNINGNDKKIKNIISELEKIAQIDIIQGMSIICITGKNINKNIDVIQRIFNCLKRNNISPELILKGASPTSISIVVSKEKSIKALKEIHKEFFEKRKSKIKSSTSRL